jgi:peptidoglycan/LPS O-acetylase OafA/YrhL
MIHLPLLWFSATQLRGADPHAFAGWNVTSAGAVCVLFVVCVALSTLSYRLVERPFLLLKARIDA